ncbi:MAG TPA: sigma 54-interacting transcriptional regulator [Chthoniobacterales bacterium]
MREPSESIERTADNLAEDALHRAVDTTPAFIHTGRPDGYLDYFNRGWLGFFGKSLEEVSGWRWTELVHPEDVATLVQKWHEALASGEPLEVESRVRRADGTYRAFLHRKVPLRDEYGNIVKWFGSSIDIEDQKRAEQRVAEKASELERNESYLREGERLARMGSWSLRPEGIFDYWSPETFSIFGFDPSQGIPTLKEWLDVLHPTDGDRVHELIQRMFSEGVKGDIQYRVEHPQHGQKTMHSIGEPILEDGEVARLIGNTLDITRQEKLTQELRRREAYLAEAQRLSHTGSFGWDVSSGEIFWSDETFRIFELDPKIEITTELIVQRTLPEDRQAVQKVIERASRDRTEFALEHRLLMPDGSIKFVHVVGRPSTGDGRRSEFVGAVTDITDQRQAEQKIREQEIELRKILDLTPQQIAVSGSDGKPLYVNPAALEYFGVTMDQWRVEANRPEASCAWLEARLDLVHPDDREHFLSERRKGLLKGAPFEFEVRLRRHDGKFRCFLCRQNPLKDQRGQITRWYSTATDIEDRKQAEEEIRRENILLREELGKTSMFEEVIGTSPVLQMVLARAAKVAPTDSTVLIMGETGTGKELIARAIHKRSERSERPFISVNCAAVPASLIMSELFGHEKGAFTGALQRRPGRFELAEGGTLLLDEVGDLPAETQIALLRVLQEREFERVGGTEVLRADVRVIAATNRDLQAAIADGAFRSDLYYRLNVFPIELPPLRERKGDVPLLVNYFVDRYAKRAGKKIKHIQKKTLEMLQEYSWPGNVRELQNVIERSLIITETNEFSIDKSWVANEPRSSTTVTDRKSNERQRIEAALAQSNGKISGSSGAAAKLGLPASTLESKIRSLRINKFQFKGV